MFYLSRENKVKVAKVDCINCVAATTKVQCPKCKTYLAYSDQNFLDCMYHKTKTKNAKCKFVLCGTLSITIDIEY